MTEQNETSTHPATARPTGYSVSCLPEGDANGYLFDIAVVYRGWGSWAVERHGSCLGGDGKWSWEALPSSREDEWLESHRFSLDKALELAKATAPFITVNGHTVAEALAAGEKE